MPYDLPLVLVPPEVIEMETLSTASEEVQIKKEDWPEFFIRLFPNDVGDLLLIGVPFFFNTMSAEGLPRLQHLVRLCYADGPVGHHRNIRGQSKGMCPSVT